MTHYANIVTKLNKNTSIESWRKAKELADKEPDFEETLGCVGRPIAELLQSILEEHVAPEHVLEVARDIQKASDEARENLASFVSQYVESELSCVLDCYSFDISDADIDITNSLDDAFDAGVGAVCSALSGYTCYIDSESLG